MTSTPSMPDEQLDPGATLGRYVVTRRIGGGAMGQVYEARHADLDKRVAIKVMGASLGSSPELRERFLREGRAAARVRHAHAVDITDVGVEGAALYLVMEYLEGEDLAALIAREAPLAPERVADLMLPVVSALSDVHHEGIVHRDLKPANVFLARTRHGALHPKLLDFGVSKLLAQKGGPALTDHQTVLGTPVYMSPEQVRSALEADARSDVYSLGTILYECATGRRSVTDRNVVVIFQRVAAGEFVPPRKVNPSIPPDFEAVILRAMAFRPADRFASMTELGRALLPFASPSARVLWAPAFGGVPTKSVIQAALSPHAHARVPTAPPPMAPPPQRTGLPPTLDQGAPATRPSAHGLSEPPTLRSAHRPARSPRKIAVMVGVGVLAVAVVGVGFAVTLHLLGDPGANAHPRRPPSPSPHAASAPVAPVAPVPTVAPGRTVAPPAVHPPGLTVVPGEPDAGRRRRRRRRDDDDSVSGSSRDRSNTLDPTRMNPMPRWH